MANIYKSKLDLRRNTLRHVYALKALRKQDSVSCKNNWNAHFGKKKPDSLSSETKANACMLLVGQLKMLHNRTPLYLA